MEILGDLNREYINDASKHKFEEILDRINQVIESIPHNNVPNFAHILDLCKIMVRKYQAVRQRYYTNFDTAEAEYNAASAAFSAATQEEPAATYGRALSGSAYFIQRGWHAASLKWPVMFMDVVPAFKFDYQSVIALLCERSRAYQTDKHPREIITPPQITICTAEGIWGVNFMQTAPARKMVAQIDSFVDSCVRVLIARFKPAVDRPTIRFIFDHTRVIRPMGIGLHPFDIFYEFFAWARNDRLRRAFPEMVALNYKIADWLTWEILTRALPACRSDVDVYIVSNRLTSISWLFTSIGSEMCNANIQFVFNDAAADVAPAGKYVIKQPAGKASSMSDIMSAEAFYFTYYHEIFRANHGAGETPTLMSVQSTPPSVINNMTPAGSPLYFELVRLHALLNHPLVVDLPRTETADDVEYNAVLTRGIIYGNAKPVPSNNSLVPSNELLLLVAPPGTGKTTYVNALNHYAKLPMDEIGEKMHLGGISVIDRLEAIKTLLNQTINSAALDLKTKRVMYNTLLPQIQSKIKQPAQSCIGARRGQIINEVLGKGYNMLVDTVTGIVVPSYMGFALDPCDNLVGDFKPTQDYIKFTSMPNFKMTLLYLHFADTYNQQVSRYVAEGRISRFYRWLRLYRMVWESVFDREVLKKITVIAYEGPKSVIICEGGVCNEKVLLEYLKNNTIDTYFEKFLRNNYDVDLQRVNVNH